MIEQWLNPKKTGRKGASNTYSHVAIELMATLSTLFGLAGGQIEGFLESIFSRFGSRFTSPRPQYLVSSLG